MRWHNEARYQARLAAIPDRVREAMKAEIARAADQGVIDAKRFVPVNEPTAPHIRDTIHRKPGRHDLSVVVSVGGPSAPYAAPLEFGHMTKGAHVRARPFFFPAMAKARRRLRARLARAIRKALRVGSA